MRNDKIKLVECDVETLKELKAYQAEQKEALGYKIPLHIILKNKLDELKRLQSELENTKGNE